MTKRMDGRVFVFIMLVLFAALTVLSSMNVIDKNVVHANDSMNGSDINEVTNMKQNVAAYEIRPIIEKYSYDVNENIPIEIVVDADSSIDSVTYSSHGFGVNGSLSIIGNKVLGSMFYSEYIENPQFTVFAMLQNGVELQADIYGYATDKKVYINVNSLFGARDVYWSEMLENGIFTQVDYETYLTNRIPTVSADDTMSSDDGASTTATNYQITVSGVLQWKDDWSKYHPLQYIKVVVMNEGGGLLGLWDTSLGTTYTDEKGFYSLSFTHSGACNPYVKIYPEGENVVVKTGTGRDYLCQSASRKNITSKTTINYTVDMNDEIGQAFQISQAVISAARFAKIVNGSKIDSVTVKYPSNENNMRCYYSSKTIYICGIRANDTVSIDGSILHTYASWDVMQHEYFHHVQSMLNIKDSPGHWHALGTNMYIHYMSHHGSNSSSACLKSDGKIGCANPSKEKAKDAAIKITYGEAVASVLSGIAQKYFVDLGTLKNIKTVGDALYTAYNGAVIDYENQRNRIGEVEETTICAILWDIYDDASDIRDTVSLGYQGFWNVLVENKNKTLSDFITTFYNMYPNYVHSIGDNLSYYRVAASHRSVSDVLLEKLPTFNWVENGSDNSAYNNNIFEIIFYNKSKSEIFSKKVAGTSYTLTASEWNNILSSRGDYFFWAIKASQKESNSGLVTGPYMSGLSQVSKPTGTIIEADKSAAGTIAKSGDYKWYKFVAPSSGKYTFYTEGTTDTYGDLFSTGFYGLDTTDRLTFDDDSGESKNFKIDYQLYYNQTVYLRVRAFSSNVGSYTLKVELNEHVHSYTVRYSVHNDDKQYHESYCDCGEYILEEHESLAIGNKKARCIYCQYTITAPPGTEISSVKNRTKEYVIYKKYGE